MKSDLTCPVEVVSVDIREEEAGSGSPVCLITFRNLGEKTVDSVQMNIICYDSEGARLGGRLVRAHAHERTETGFTGAFRPEHVAGTARVEASVEKLWFTDGMLWRREERNVREYTPNQLPEGRELDRLRRVAGPDAAGYAREEDKVWLCVCGRANRTSDESCRRCHRERQQVLEEYSKEAIDSTIGKREKVLSEASMDNARRSSAQNAQEAKAARERENRKRKRMQGIILLLFVVAALLALWRWGLPALGMRIGEMQLSGGRPQQAMRTFETVASLFPQTEAEDGVRRAEGAILDGMIASGDKTTLEEAVLRAGQSGDTERKRRAELTLAKLLLDTGDEEGAETLLRGMPGNEEAETLLCALVYDRACRWRDGLEYEKALNAFTELGGYEDSAAQAEDVRYLWGRALMREGDYAGAQAQFMEVITYRDSLELLRTCRYQQALEQMGLGQYELAATGFESLGIYEQAETLGRQCRYSLAQAAEKGGDLPEAARQYAMAAAYEDAPERFAETALSLGKEALEEGDYETAITWLEQLPLTGEVRELYQQAVYSYAAELEESGDREGAHLQFAGLGDYEDALDRARAIAYALAEEEMDTDPESALDRFTDLGEYRDSAKKAQSCLERLAERAFAAKEYEVALDWYERLQSGTQRTEQMTRCRYFLAGEKEAAEEWAEAEALYRACGSYLDAEEGAERMAYRQAEALEAAGEYEAAAAAFRQLTYPGAQESTVRCEDAWLGDVFKNARLDLETGDYLSVIDAVEPYLEKELPQRYGTLPELYEQACMARAQALIDIGHPLDALPYLEKIPDSKASQKRLQDYVYRVVGRWKDRAGAEYTFRRDGSCTLAGHDGYFGGSGYEIRFGEEPYPTKAAYQVVNLRGQTLTLRDLAQDKNIRLTYVGKADIPVTAEEAAEKTAEEAAAEQ